MTEIRADLAVADAADPDGSRPLDVDDFKTDATGAAKETTQGAVKTVLEAIRDRLPSSLSGGRLKTEITQAAGTTVLVESVPGTPIDIADAATVVADVYVGITVAEQTTITEALVRVRDEDATGSILDSIPLLPGEGVSYVYAPGRTATSGTVYVEVVSGTVEGSVFTV